MDPELQLQAFQNLTLSGNFPISPPESPSQNSNPDEFMRIIPKDELSRRAFHDLANLQSQGELRPENSKFVVVTGKALIDGEWLFQGFFSIGWHLHFDFPAPLEIGRAIGSDPITGIQYGQVHVLLVPARSIVTNKIALLHLQLRIHPYSTAWNVIANAPLTVKNYELNKDGSICFSDPRTDVNIRGLIYEFTFTIDNEEAKKRF
ncbi:MAG: hypothetical protein Q9217_007094, partial [Psora testacea]